MESTTMYNHILISTVGSDVAQQGVDHGLSLAKALDAKVIIETVTERFPIYTGGMASAGWIPGPTEMAEYDAGQKEWADGVLKRAKAGADKLGVETETVHGPAAPPAE